MTFPPRASNAASLPYAVRLQGWSLAGTVIVHGLLVAAPLVVILSEGLASDPFRLAIQAVLVLVGVYAALRLWRLKDPELQLFTDRLERPGLTSTRVLYRSDIAGVSRTISTRSGSYFNIVPQPGQGDPIQLTGSLRDDPVFAEWLSGLPDPSALAAAADRASVLADERYGQSERERANRLRLATGIVIGFSVACAAAGAAVGFLNPPPLASLGLAIACIGGGLLLTSLFNGLIVWLPRSGVRPSAVAALIPAAALALRGLLTIHLLNTGPLMIAAAVIGVAAGLLAFQRPTASAQRAQGALAAGVAMAFLSYGAAAYVDALPNHAPAHVYVVAVEGKSISRGRSTSYDLALAPWGDQPGREVSVSSDLYGQVDIGGDVCVARHPGDLGIPWFDIGICAVSPPSPAS